MNRNKLLGKMAEAGYTQRSLAMAVGMSENSMGSKINGKRPFNTNEILAICKLLEIKDGSEKAQIFLV